MAIDLNNATFKLFTDFATQAKSLNTRAQLPLDNVGLETFCGHVGKLVDQVEEWKRFMVGFRYAEDEAEDAAEEAAALDDSAVAGQFMRV